jgi:hypothetical protein
LLFGGFAIKFDWLSRLNGFELEKAVFTFVQLGLKIIYGKFHDDWTLFVAFGYVILIVTTLNMAANF